MSRTRSVSRICLVAVLAALFGSFSFESVAGAQDSAAESVESQTRQDIGFVGLHGGVYEHLLQAAEPLGLTLAYFDDDSIETGSADLSSVRVLYIQHTRADDREAYRNLFMSARRANPNLVIIAFQSSTAELFAQLDIDRLLTGDERAARYYGNSTENLRRLLLYTGATYLGRDWEILPAEELRVSGFHHPDAPQVFDTADEMLVWLRRERGALPDRPRVLIAVHGTHLAFQQPKVVDALILEAERQGAVAAAIVDGRSDDYRTQVAAFGPSVVIHTCHSMEPLDLRREIDVPHLHSIFIRKESIDEFQSSVRGLSNSELAFHVIGQELLGAIEPQVGGGTVNGTGSSEEIVPIPDRIEHLVRRALAYARLRITEPSEKKVAIVYYDREMGKGELMRGSSTGMHMNGPRSLLGVLAAMRDRGYTIDPLPTYEEELLGMMMSRGRQVGVWAPGDLDRLVREGNPVLVPAEQYREWYLKRIPEDRRQELDAKWGPPPGRFMVWSDGSREFVVIPRIELGNVVLLPQPLRGELHGSETLSSQAHDKKTAPPHNYLATYFWLEEAFGADAVVHFGTHGSEFMLPGKPSGLARRDWPDILMGSMPNFNPWIIENMVESSPVKRRVYGTLVSHLPPPIVDAGLSDGLENLHETIDKWEILEEGALREAFRRELTRLILENHLEQDLELDLAAGSLASDSVIATVAKYLHDIKEETTPISLHVYGESPREDLLIPYLVQILRAPFLHELEHLSTSVESSVDIPREPSASAEHESADAADGHHHHGLGHDLRTIAERIVGAVVRDGIEPELAVGAALGRTIERLPESLERALASAVDLARRFGETDDEIENLLRGLDGRFVPPGPGNSPIRNPNAVPTGRNMYLLNPEEVPTRPSWELGTRLVRQMIEQHQAKHGTFPTKYGLDLRSSATYRDYGVMEAQILYLIGIEPVWDDKGLVNDVRLIDRETLGRPRVDVFIAAGGWYESNLPTRLELWDKAVRLAAESPEPDNPLATNNRITTETLIDQGIDPDRAVLLARGRIFGLAPGRESTGALSYQVLRSGDWEDREQIADAYLATHKHIFTAGAWGEPAEAAYDQTIQGTHTVVRSWSDHMTGPLASRYTWLHGGALCLAVERITGRRPEYRFSDVRDPDSATMIDAEEALRREYRVRLFNRKWLEGMMKEGYAGADHMRFLVSNSFAWEVMRPGSVGDANWNEMKQVLVDDKLNLGLRDWFDRTNPYAHQDALAAMLEAVRKGYWQADQETKRQLAREYASIVARHGMSGNIVSGGNRALHRHLEELLGRSDSQDDRDRFAAYDAKYQEQFRSPASSTPTEPPVDLDITTAAPSAAPDVAASTSPAIDSSSSSNDAEPPNDGDPSGDTDPESASVAASPSITGRQLVPSESPPPAAADGTEARWYLLLGGLVIAFFLIGAFRGRSRA